MPVDPTLRKSLVYWNWTLPFVSHRLGTGALKGHVIFEPKSYLGIDPLSCALAKTIDDDEGLRIVACERR